MENDGAPADAAAARQVLAQLHTDRARAAGQVQVPWWYRFGLALAVVAFIRAFALDGEAFTAVISSSALAAVLLGVLRPWVTGTQADPWNDQAALRVGLALTAVVVVTGAAGVALFTSTGWNWVLWVAAVAAGAACFGLGSRMETILTGSIRQARP
jgi:hypothetical protein